MHGDDGDHAEGGVAEPVVPLAGPEPAHDLEHPVDHAEGRVEDPQPSEGRERDGRRPGHQDQETDEELAAEVLEQRAGEEVAHDNDQELRDEREDESVAERPLEHRAHQDVLEVLKPHEGEVEAARRRVGQAEEQREQEWQGDQQEDVRERRRQEELAQAAVTPRQGVGGLLGSRGERGFYGVHRSRQT